MSSLSDPSRDRARSGPPSDGPAAMPAGAVRSGTLSWGEVPPDLEVLSAVAWPARTEDLPPASAVRGGTLRWASGVDEPASALEPRPSCRTFNELLLESIPAGGGTETHGDEGRADLKSAIESAIEGVHNPRKT